MLEDWIGEVGELELSQGAAESWQRVAFDREIEDPVVVAGSQSANGAHPFTLAIRGVDETGFEIRIDEWDYLDGAHGAETVSWIAVSEGRHALADGRVIEAGAATLAAVDGPRFAGIGFAAEYGTAPVVLGQIQSETDGAATTRLHAVTAEGFAASLQAEEAATGAVAASFGWIAVAGAAVEQASGQASGQVAGVTHVPGGFEAEAGAIFAQAQTANGPDTATVALDLAGDRIWIAEEASADAETTHAAETVGFAGFDLGGLAAIGLDAAPAAADLAADGPVERWSDPATWGGALPGPGDVVVIEAGRTVLLDTDVALAGLMVHGTLVAEDSRDLALATDWMMVMDGGDFIVGTADAPFVHEFTLTLTGDPEDRTDWASLHDDHADACPVTGGVCKCALAALEADETGFLMAMGEGSTIALHSADAAKTDWTRLAATVEAGSRMLRLEADAGWEVGDAIVIASTDFDMEQAETATIAAISADGTRIELDRALAHMHFGALQTYADGSLLDTRAEVGLLSRNIVIRGDEDAHLDGFGGHTMVMQGAEMRIAGVEFTRMGQAGALGKYPAHWHQIGDAAGQWITDSSFHETYNRAITVHGTDNARIEDNVAHDVIGHTFFLEDGSETGNRFEGNLGLVTRAAAPGEGTTPTDETHVATFWITNPDNTFLGNVAGGAEHGGFWFAPAPGEATLALGRFEGNVAHSNAFANLAFDGHADPETGVFVESEYHPAGDAVVRDFTSYKSADRAIWVRAEGIEFHDVKSADNARATFFSYNQVIYDSLIVGRSANIGTPETAEEIAQGRSLPEPYNGRYFRGHSIYDGPSGVIDSHFAGFTDLDAAFQSNGAAQKSPAHFVSGLGFEDVSAAGRVDFAPQTHVGHMWSSGILDVDGSLSGTAGARLMPILADTAGGESRLHVPDGGIRREDWGAWVLAEADIGLLRADTDIAPGTADVVRWTRSDGETIADGGTFDTYHQSAAVLNSDLSYRLQYPEIPGEITLSLRFAEAGDTVLVELPGMPSDAALTGAVEVAGRAALAAADGSAFTREGDLLVLRLVADTEEADPRFRANTALGAAAASRFVAGVRIETGAPGNPVVADFDGGADPRLVASGRSAAVSAPTPAWQDQPDSIVFWDVVSDGDGSAGHGDMSILLDGADWSGADTLDIRAATQALGGGTVAGYKVFIRDAGDGVSYLGQHDGHAAVDLSGLAPELRDEVDQLLFRVAETAVAPDIAAAGDGQRLILFDVTLGAGFAARAVDLPALIPAGESFGIVSAAITGAQGGQAGLAVAGVSDPVGGRVRTGVPGQGDNVFFDTDADFRGIASFTVTLRDAAGREDTARVSFEVTA
ncbi:hypothetical protein LNKW23_34180 [Paralimibaculum aggregatum]|uniref:G8 domain-containing protein n=1 Tax=Paralimibaculum aggregatum TaxID=3036245 RepID=A0ABQ6LP94_9RHOB|nr:G8 domain-containing protein [Limibaculum sp. NKW23]GMG84204.1 hypothetical protein LNKW23_34180 [Limibaculum sp. NKW23]